MTLADYETFLSGRPEHERWELIRGVIVAMTNPTGNHGQIAMNIAVPVKLASDAIGCRTYAGSMRVQRSPRHDGGDATIPDVVVQCGRDRNRTFVTDPVVIVEVLSRSTMVRDRGVKFEFYRSLPTLQHLVHVYQDQMRVEHYRRSADDWLPLTLIRPSDRLALDAIGASLDLDTIYRDVPMLRPVETGDVAETDEPNAPDPVP